MSASQGAPDPALDAVRVDKWLWAARFFRSRSLAVDAIRRGQVACNGARISKASRNLRQGDELAITRGDDRLEVTVVGLSEQRGPARVAQTLYAESPASIARREERAANRRAARLSAPLPPQSRPDKHARARIRKLLGK